MSLSKKYKNGFTLIELLVVISIIALLSSVVLASLNSARSKARYAQAVSIMNGMEKAAALDYNDNGTYAIDVSNGVPPSFVPKYLSVWSTPPCAGWSYDWENWGSGIVRISLRRANVTTVYFSCIQSNPSNGDCASSDGVDIKTISNKIITCNE